MSDEAVSTPFSLDRYRVEEQLGSGGLGTVLRATEMGTGRVVALKMLDAASDRDRGCPADVSAESGLRYSAVYLLLPKDERLVAVGAVALIPGDLPLIAMDPRLLQEVTRGIYDAADVQTVFLGIGARSSLSPSQEPGRPSAQGE